MRSSIGIDSNKTITDPIDEASGNVKVSQDETLMGVMGDILSELKLMNARIECMVGSGIDHSDISHEL